MACSAAGALPQPEMPQPGPVFQALPEPAPLPPLPRPAPQLQTMPAEAMAAMAPMSAMAGEAQPGAQYQVPAFPAKDIPAPGLNPAISGLHFHQRA